MSVIVSTDQDFNTIIAENDKVIVKYYADWCGACRLFSPKYRRLSDDAKNEGIVFLDVNAEESPEARKLAGVTNLPFFATFKGGKLFKADFTTKPESVEAMIAELQS